MELLIEIFDLQNKADLDFYLLFALLLFGSQIKRKDIKNLLKFW